MAIPEFLATVQATALARYMSGDAEGAAWAFPVVETVHVMALATVYGSIVMVDLRMLGLASRDLRLSTLTNEVLPWTWTAFIIAALSGSLLFISRADAYWDNFATRGKFLCMALAGVNMLLYQFGTHRRVAEWDSCVPPPLAVRAAGALSILLWTGAIFFGRWIGFTI